MCPTPSRHPTFDRNARWWVFETVLVPLVMWDFHSLQFQCALIDEKRNIAKTQQYNLRLVRAGGKATASENGEDKERAQQTVACEQKRLYSPKLERDVMKMTHKAWRVLERQEEGQSGDIVDGAASSPVPSLESETPQRLVPFQSHLSRPIHESGVTAIQLIHQLNSSQQSVIDEEAYEMEKLWW